MWLPCAVTVSLSRCSGHRPKRNDLVFFFSSRRRHTRWPRDWSSDVCSSDLGAIRRGRGSTRTISPGASPGQRCRRRHRLGGRSEERRVGKECRGGGWREQEKEKEEKARGGRGRRVVERSNGTTSTLHDLST